MSQRPFLIERFSLYENGAVAACERLTMDYYLCVNGGCRRARASYLKIDTRTNVEGYNELVV